MLLYIYFKVSLYNTFNIKRFIFFTISFKYYFLFIFYSSTIYLFFIHLHHKSPIHTTTTTNSPPTPITHTTTTTNPPTPTAHTTTTTNPPPMPHPPKTLYPHHKSTTHTTTTTNSTIYKLNHRETRGGSTWLLGWAMAPPKIFKFPFKYVKKLLGPPQKLRSGPPTILFSTSFLEF